VNTLTFTVPEPVLASTVPPVNVIVMGWLSLEIAESDPEKVYGPLP
jgi:hypothetical protein